MAKVATAKQTGGGGFDFEDKVTAYFISYLLLAKFPLQPEIGLLERVDFQVRPMGWLFDDLLLTMKDGNHVHKVAVSAKSNRQITATGFPDDILTDIWTQYLNAGQKVFDPLLDYMLFVVSPLGRSVSENLSILINTARVTSPKDMISRLDTGNFSVPQKTLFNSLKCPAVLKTAHNVSDEDTCKMLLRIIVKEFDFQSNASNDQVSLIGILQDCLISKQPAEAQFLYKRLAGLRKEFANFGGYVDYGVLLSKITPQFKLAGVSQHDEDWKKIERLFHSKSENIPDLLGQIYTINRDGELERLAGMLAINRVVFLLGPSGSGKTVMAKKMARQTESQNAKVIWFDAAMLMSGTPEHLFNLSHSINELMSKCLSANNLLVFDGADRLYKKEFVDVMASLIRIALTLPKGHWNVLITSQQDDYEELVKKLSRSNLQIQVSEIFDLEVIGKEKLLDVSEQFPNLADLVKHEHLHKLLYNLKFLDLIIFNISKDNAKVLLKEFGESHLIDWLWQQEILDRGENGDANSRFLQSLAEKQANELSLFTPVTEFQISESAPISELKLLKIIAENEDRLYFTHDLFGDWARYKMIRANKDKINTYLPKIDLFSPLWCKAVRLFGIYLLERKNDSTEWLTTYNQFNGAEPESKMIQNLLLESIIFSNNTEKYLNDLWEEFKKEDAKILNDFFEQFFFKATLPNPAVLQLAGKLQGITVSQLATFNRVPKFIYWMPVMRFVTAHINDLIALSRKNAMKIAKDWLDYTPPGAIFRDTAADIGVKMGKWLIDFKEDGGYAFDHSGKNFYQTMLMAFREKPAEVKELSLKLCRRIPPEKPRKKERGDHPMFTSWNPRRGTVLPDGPFDRVDDDFEEACLDTENLVPMMKTNPELAKEILLAVLICDPEAVQDPGSHHFKYNINEPHQWFPPFYTRGPFLNFFNTAPSVALNFLITLTNFAAEEWKLEQQARGEEVTFITLDIPGAGARNFYGDNRVYYWFRDIGNAPHSLISILMAFEKFLIDQVDSGKELDDIIIRILENSNSLALIGLISSVGRYSRKLFLTVLKPLLTCLEIYQLESGLDYGAMGLEGHQNMGSNFFDTTTQQLSWKWHAMPHRMASIKSIALPLMLSYQEIHDLFKNKIIPEWTKINQEYTDSGFVDASLVNLIAQFNSENYVPFQNEQQVGLIYQEPGEVTQQLEVVRSSTAIGSDDFTFAFSKQRDLEQNKAYDLPVLEEIWIKIQGFYGRAEGNLFEHHNHRLSNIFAGVGILVENYNKLKDVHPEYFDWIAKVVTEVLDKTTFDLRESTMIIGPGSWEGFAANFVPLLFAKDPADKVRRRWIALMALNSNNEAVGRLFKATTGFFKFNDRTFIQLQNLMIQRSHLVSKHIPGNWQQTTDWKEIFKKPLEDFIRDETQMELIDICSFIGDIVEEDEPDEVHRIRRRGRQVKPLRDTGIDLDLLFHALQFPELTPVLDVAERDFIFKWYQKLVELQTAGWGPVDDAEIPLDISLHPFDHWFILKLSNLLPKINSAETELLWKPLLAYGNLSSKWLISFFDNLLVYNYEKPENYDGLGLVWNEMIDFALGHSNWKYKGGFYRDHWELWQGVLGISNLQLEVWKLGYEELLIKFSQKTIEYITRSYINSDAINKLAVLLRSPGAANFIIPGVLLIAAHLKFQDALDAEEPPEGKVRVPFEHYDSVANTCSYLWLNHKQNIKSDGRTFLSFKNIVIHLVAIQNAIGLELQDRLIE